MIRVMIKKNKFGQTSVAGCRSSSLLHLFLVLYQVLRPCPHPPHVDPIGLARPTLQAPPTQPNQKLLEHRRCTLSTNVAAGNTSPTTTQKFPQHMIHDTPAPMYHASGIMYWVAVAQGAPPLAPGAPDSISDHSSQAAPPAEQRLVCLPPRHLVTRTPLAVEELPLHRQPYQMEHQRVHRMVRQRERWSEEPGRSPHRLSRARRPPALCRSRARPSLGRQAQPPPVRHPGAQRERHQQERHQRGRRQRTRRQRTRRLERRRPERPERPAAAVQ